MIELLEKRAGQIRALEKRAHAAIQMAGDQSEYEAIMREKARLLAELHDDVVAVDSSVDAATENRLAVFSESAANSLRIGSVFYMSALLFPEDHQPGTPNDLEVFIETLKRESAG